MGLMASIRIVINLLIGGKVDISSGLLFEKEL